MELTSAMPLLKACSTDLRRPRDLKASGRLVLHISFEAIESCNLSSNEQAIGKTYAFLCSRAVHVHAYIAN